MSSSGKFATVLLGTCGAICGQPGHAQNDKPHVRNDACWNWRPIPRQPESLLKSPDKFSTTVKSMGRSFAHQVSERLREQNQPYFGEPMIEWTSALFVEYAERIHKEIRNDPATIIYRPMEVTAVLDRPGFFGSPGPPPVVKLVDALELLIRTLGPDTEGSTHLAVLHAQGAIDEARKWLQKKSAEGAGG